MRYLFNGIARDGAGNIIPSATCSIYLAGTTTPATVYTTAVIVTSVSSITSGTDGSFSFYVDDVDYAGTQRFKIYIAKSGYTAATYDYLTVFDINALLDTDSTLAANSDTKIPSQQAIKEYIDALDVGVVKVWPTETVPAGHLECDGSSLARVGTYARLFAVIGDLYGTADGAHFNIPDYRGKFLRGWNHGKAAGTYDPDAATRTAPTTTGATILAGDHVGTEQDHAAESHLHTVNPPDTESTGESTTHTHPFGFITRSGSVGTDTGDGFTAGTQGAQTYTTGNNSVDHHHHVNIAEFNSGSTGGNESRPINVNVMYIIKY